LTVRTAFLAVKVKGSERKGDGIPTHFEELGTKDGTETADEVTRGGLAPTTQTPCHYLRPPSPIQASLSRLRERVGVRASLARIAYVPSTE